VRIEKGATPFEYVEDMLDERANLRGQVVGRQGIDPERIDTAQNKHSQVHDEHESAGQKVRIDLLKTRFFGMQFFRLREFHNLIIPCFVESCQAFFQAVYRYRSRTTNGRRNDRIFFLGLFDEILRLRYRSAQNDKAAQKKRLPFGKRFSIAFTIYYL